MLAQSNYESINSKINAVWYLWIDRFHVLRAIAFTHSVNQPRSITSRALIARIVHPIVDCSIARRVSTVFFTTIRSSVQLGSTVQLCPWFSRASLQNCWQVPGHCQLPTDITSTSTCQTSLTSPHNTRGTGFSM